MAVKDFSEFMVARHWSADTDPREWATAFDDQNGITVQFAVESSAGGPREETAVLEPGEDGKLRVRGEISEWLDSFLFGRDGTREFTPDTFEETLRRYDSRPHLTPRQRDFTWSRHGSQFDVRLREQVLPVIEWLNPDDQQVNEEGFASRIVGLRLGAAVSGSDVEVGPYAISFPFDPDVFETMAQGILEEADFYYDRDNSSWYVVKSPGGQEWYPKLSEDGSWNNEEGIPREILDELENMDGDIYFDRETGFDLFPGWTWKLYTPDITF